MTLYLPPGGGTPAVHIGQTPRGEAKRLRVLARGKRGGKVPITERGLTPRRVWLSRERGWSTSPSVIRVDAYSRRWANPFEGERHAVNKFVEFLRTSPDRVFVTRDGRSGRYPSDAEIRSALGGYELGCFCRRRQRCHADVLLRIAAGGAP